MGAATMLGTKVKLAPKEALAEIRAAFATVDYSASRAAAKLGVDRTTLWRWVAHLGIVKELSRAQARADKACSDAYARENPAAKKAARAKKR